MIALDTQWRVGGMGSRYGLDYAALPAVLDLLGIEPSERKDVFESIRVMEGEALTIFNKDS